MLTPRPSFRPCPAAPLRRVVKGLVLTVCALTWLSGLSARGDIQQPPKPTGRGDREVRRQEPPTTALAGRARVGLDGSVEIVLEANGGEGRTIDFILRDAPIHGTLVGPPRQLTRTTAAVTYVHRVADGVQDDSFTFATQARGSKVSAAAPVVIGVTDSPPELAASPGELDFGAVKTGDTSRAELTLENRGGGVASGWLFAPPPWQVEGLSEYRLTRGERRTFQIVFRPDRGDAFVETWHFAGDEGRPGVRLIGTGLGSPVLADRGPTTPLVAIPDTSGRSLPMDEVNAIPAPVASPPSTPGPSPSNPAPAAAMPPPVEPLPAMAAAPSPAEEPEAEAPLTNLAQVTQVEARGTGASTVDLAWTPPTPTPRSYRVEMRYLLLPTPEDEGRNNEIVPPRIEWQEYGPTDIRAKANAATAHLRGLDPFTIYALRVVALDRSGHPASPSPVLFVRTQPGSTFWQPTPFKVLSGLLLVCLTIYMRRRWRERRMLAEETAEIDRSVYSGGSLP